MTRLLARVGIILAGFCLIALAQTDATIELPRLGLRLQVVDRAGTPTLRVAAVQQDGPAYFNYFQARDWIVSTESGGRQGVQQILDRIRTAGMGDKLSLYVELDLVDGGVSENRQVVMVSPPESTPWMTDGDAPYKPRTFMGNRPQLRGMAEALGRANRRRISEIQKAVETLDNQRCDTSDGEFGRLVMTTDIWSNRAGAGGSAETLEHVRRVICENRNRGELPEFEALMAAATYRYPRLSYGPSSDGPCGIDPTADNSQLAREVRRILTRDGYDREPPYLSRSAEGRERDCFNALVRWKVLGEDPPLPPPKPLSCEPDWRPWDKIEPDLAVCMPSSFACGEREIWLPSFVRSLEAFESLRHTQSFQAIEQRVRTEICGGGIRRVSYDLMTGENVVHLEHEESDHGVLYPNTREARMAQDKRFRVTAGSPEARRSRVVPSRYTPPDSPATTPRSIRPATAPPPVQTVAAPPPIQAAAAPQLPWAVNSPLIPAPQPTVREVAKSSGDLFWTGSVRKNRPVVVEISKASAGMIEGDQLPGFPVNVTMPSRFCAITDPPSEANSWLSMTFTCSRKLASVTLNIQWAAR